VKAQIPFLFAKYHFYIKTIMYQEIRKLSYALIAILVVLGGLFVFHVGSTQAATGINKKINFQGKVTNTDGTNVADGSYSFVFSIYSQQYPGGSVIWTETKSLTTTDGIFQTNLGDTATLPGSVDFNTDNIFLGINFNSNGEMNPRVQFTASPYAFNSDKLEGGTWEIPGAIGSTTRNSALFTTLGVNGSSTLASNAGSTMTLGNSTGAATIASGGVSSWTNAAGNLTFSTTSSGILALTSAGALNLSAAAASTMALANVTNSFNIDSNTLSVDALNNRIGIGTAGPTAFLDVAAATTGAASIRLEASAGVNPSAPNIGDMWFNGSNLYFRKDGSTSQDLLAAGGGGMTNPMTTQGDLIFGGASGIPTRLAGAGTNGYVLKYATGTNTPYWAADLTGGGGNWALNGIVEYLSATTDDIAVGGNTLASPFSVDVSLNTTRIGSGATNNGILDMYASNGAKGSLEYTTNDSWNFSGGNVGIGTANPSGLFNVYKDFNPTFGDGSYIDVSSIAGLNNAALNITYNDPNNNLGGPALNVTSNGGASVVAFASTGLGGAVLDLNSNSPGNNSNAQLITGYSNSITTNALLSFSQGTSAFSGDGMKMNFESGGSGSFTGNFLRMQKNGIDKFLVSNNGGVTVNGSDSSIVKQTPADFSLGTIGTSLTNADGALSLADTVSGGIPNSGKGTITTGGVTTSAAIGAGSFSITRPDGKFAVIRGGGTGIDIYDSVAETFTNSSMTMTAAIGAGAIALPRPGGTYRVLHGGGSTTSSLVDPMGNLPVVANSVPIIAKAAGTVAFLRPNGRYLVTNGGAAGTTQLYDPVSDTFVTGPINIGTLTWGVGSLVLNKNDGQALVLVGGAQPLTQLYDPNAGVVTGVSPIGAFTVGPTLDGKQPAGTCGLNGNGSVGFRRQDGKFVVLSKANVWAVYDPNANDFTCNASGGPATAIGDGGHAIPLQDGKFLVIVGGGSTASYVYNPADNSFTAHGTALAAVTTGAHSIMEVDGTWHIINGGGTATNSYDTGLPMSDANTIYTSEDIFSSSLNSNSSLWWRAQMESVYNNSTNGAVNSAFSTLQFIVKTAVSSDGFQTGCAAPLNAATEEEIKSSGDLVGNALGANCIRVKIKYNRPIPRRLFDERGVWAGNGMVVLRFDGVTPRVFNYKIDNSAVLKRTNFDFSSTNTSAPTNPTIPAALTATQSASGGSCTAGTHAYYSTFITNGVESQLSTKSNVITCAGGTDKVNLTVIPIGPAGTTARKIYRTAAGDTGTPLLVTTIADNSTVSLTSDTAADTALGAAYTLIENSGPVMTKSETRVETVNGNLVLPYGRIMGTTQIPNAGATSFSGYYMGRYSNAHQQLTNAAGQGTIVIARDDKQFLIIEPGGNFADLYDPATETFTNQTAIGDKPTSTNAAGVGAGAFALKRADGTFLVYLGTLSTTATCTVAGTATNIYNPNQASGSRFTNGPCLTAAGGLGAQAILNNDGSYTILHGNGTATTSIYSQMTNTMIIGPTAPALINCGSWAIPLSLPNNNQYRIKVGVAPAGAAAGALLNYDANTKVFSSQPALAVSTGCGSVAFQRPDGYWVATGGETSGAQQLVTALINPQTGVSSAGPSMLTTGTGRGTTVIPRADGTFLIVLGNPAAAGALSQSQVYLPTGGAAGTTLGVPIGQFISAASIPSGPQMGPIPAPAAPTVAVAVGATGVDVGAHYYKVTQIMNGIESVQGTASAVATTTAGNLLVNLTVVPLGATAFAGVTARRIYRTVAGAANTGTYYFVAQLNDNTTAAYADTVTDATITANPTIPLAAAPATVATISSIGAGGSVDVGVHTYKYTFVTNGVESLPAATSLTATTTAGNQTVNVAGIIAGPTGTTARKIYRTIASTTGLIGSYRLVATIADNTTLTLADTAADSTLGVPAPAAITGQGDGSISFQRPDGKWVVINGGSTASNVVGIYDAGWYSDGSYMSEMMQVPALSANSTLEWQKTADPYARFEVRTATSQAALQSAGFKGVDVPGGSIGNAGGETWVQVEINFRREFPTFCGNLNGVYVSGAGMAYCARNISLPTVLQYQITNGQDLLSLQTNSYNVLRVTSNGGIYSSQQGGFFAGGADLAENYTSNEQLEKGEVVTVDATDNHNVKRSQAAYQKDVLGIVSTAPGFVAGSYTENSYPIALVGRVPVNVTTENGMIKAGDRITAASIPGYGMRATVAGRVLGTALESMDLAKLGTCPAGGIGGINTKCGQIMVFVNLTDYQGMSAEQLMSEVESNNLNVDNNIVAETATSNSPFAQYSAQGKVLTFLETLKNSQATVNGSDIFTKNVNVTNQLVSPLIVTDTLVAKHIKAESIEGLEFIQTGLDSANASNTSNAAEVKTLGQQLTEIQNNLKALNEKVLGATTPAIGDGLLVGGSAEFNGPAIFKTIAEFMDKVIFRNNVEFEGQVVFNKDSAGYAIIKEGTDLVDITFEKEYAVAPIVNASLSLQSIEDEEVRKAAEQLLLVSDVKFVITNVTTKGLQIRIGQKAISDIPFSWNAIAIKDAKTFESKIPVLAVDKKELFNNLKNVTETVQNAVPQVLPVDKKEIPININVENQQVAGAEAASTTN
jgi:hypothetical protein